MSILKSDTTVIITTYNDSVTDLRCALKSTINQSLPPEQILVVDDGSDTNTAEKVVLTEQIASIVPITLLVKKWRSIISQKLWFTALLYKLCNVS